MNKDFNKLLAKDIRDSGFRIIFTTSKGEQIVRITLVHDSALHRWAVIDQYNNNENVLHFTSLNKAKIYVEELFYKTVGLVHSHSFERA